MTLAEGAGMYEGWEKDAERAQDNWRIVAEYEDGDGTPQAPSRPDWKVRHVEAEAGTGSRYVVVVTRLGHGVEREGGPNLVTVLWPWQDAWTLADSGYLDASYVAEHLTAGRYPDKLNGGDLYALTLTIRYALQRLSDGSDLGEGAKVSVGDGRKEA